MSRVWVKGGGEQKEGGGVFGIRPARFHVRGIMTSLPKASSPTSVCGGRGRYDFAPGGGALFSVRSGACLRSEAEEVGRSVCIFALGRGEGVPVGSAPCPPSCFAAGAIFVRRAVDTGGPRVYPCEETCFQEAAWTSFPRFTIRRCAVPCSTG